MAKAECLSIFLEPGFC